MVKKEPEGGFNVEKIVDKRITPDGRIEYLIKWRGFSDNDNTWEPEDNCQCPKMIKKFEEDRVVKMTANKKGRSKKPKIEEIVKPRGYERNLQLDRIIGASVNQAGEVVYLVKWHLCDEFDLVAGALVREHDPEVLLSYYGEKCPFERKVNIKNQGIPDFLKVFKPPEDIKMDVDQNKTEENLDYSLDIHNMRNTPDNVSMEIAPELEHLKEPDIQQDIDNEIHEDIRNMQAEIQSMQSEMHTMQSNDMPLDMQSFSA